MISAVTIAHQTEPLRRQHVPLTGLPVPPLVLGFGQIDPA
jgi:hypothetical protein